MNIIISGFSSRALVETAAKSDCKIFSFDYFGDQDLEKYTADYFSIKNSPGSHYSIKVLFNMIRDFLKKNTNKKFYFIYSSSWENYPELILELEKIDNLTVVANDSETLKKLSGKNGLYDLFKVINKTVFKTPEIIFDINLLEKKYNNFFSDSDKKYLLKPFKSGGGKGIELINSLKDYNDIKKRLENDNYYLEEYIDGKLYSAQFGADTKKASLLSITEQINAVNSDNPFQYGGNILIKADENLRKTLQKTADILTKRYSLRGVNGFDFIIKDKELYFLELNPRFTAAVELLIPIYSEDILDLYFNDNLKKNYISKFLNKDIKESGKIIYYADSDLKIKTDLKKLNSKNRRDSITLFDQSDYYIKDLPKIGERFVKGDPVFTLIIKTENRKKLWELIRKIFLEVRKYFLINNN
jgi:hypothetical protein